MKYWDKHDMLIEVTYMTKHALRASMKRRETNQMDKIERFTTQNNDK